MDWREKGVDFQKEKEFLAKINKNKITTKDINNTFTVLEMKMYGILKEKGYIKFCNYWLVVTDLGKKVYGLE